MKTIHTWILVAVLVLCPVTSRAADYGKEVQKAVKKIMHVDFKKYQFFGTPVSNFGVATMYPRAASGSDFDPTTAGLFGDPNTWWTVPDADAQVRLDRLRPAGETGQIVLSDISKKNFKLSAVVPELLSALGVNASFDWDKNVTVTVTADSAINHRINWSELSRLKNEAPPVIDKQVLAHLSVNDYLITIGDVVLVNFKVHVTVNKKMDVGADVTFKKAIAVLSADTKASFAYTSTGEGALDLVAKKPVVVASYTAAPPPGAVLAVSVPTDPPAVLFAPTVIQRLEKVAVTNKIVVK